MVIIELENKDNASSSVTYTFDCDKPDTLTFKKDTGCDWLTIETVKGTGGAKDVIKITTPKANEGERRTCYVTPMVGDYLCPANKFMVAQEGGSPPEPPEPGEKLCWRGTDNGTDYYADESDPTKLKKVSNPILLCGCAGDNKGDSIFVSDGLDYSKTGEEGTWNKLSTEGFTVGDGNWCKVQLTTTPLCCGQPSFNVSVLSDFEGTETEHVRSVTFYFKAHTYPPDGKVPACAGDGNPCTYEGAGKELCESWEYEVRQCALGYCWCGEHSKDAEAKPCGECTNKYRDCTDPYYCGTTPPDVFSINGHTSSFGDNAVKEAMEYNINNSKPAHFKISAIGGNPICKINGLIEGNIDIEGINKITWSLGDITRDTTNYIDFEDLENPSNKLSLTLWIRY